LCGTGTALAAGLGDWSQLFAQGLTGKSRTLAGFPTMTQPDDISCGPTCASMVLKWYDIEAGIGPCKTKAGTRWLEAGNAKVGMTVPSGIENCLDSYGLNPSYSPCRFKSVKNIA